jgi:Ca-activated chloride channel homolog
VLAPLWARRRIDDYMARDYLGIQNGAPTQEVRDAITGLGLEYRLVTQYTSFVAVEERVVNEGGILKTVPVPVEMPDGVSYEGVFGEADEDTTSLMPRGGVGGATRMSKSVAASPAADGMLLTESEDVAADEISATGPGQTNVPKPDAGKKPPEKVSPASQLAPELVGLADVVSRLGKNGNYSKDGIIVKKWIATVRVTVSAVSPENLAALKKLGFALTGTAKKSNIYTGRIDVRKLDALAKLGFVQYVEAKKK